MPQGYEAIIGLEIHVQLQTRSKMFCGCRNRYGAPANSLTCPVCLGLPGALPVLNDEAVRMAIALGLAVHGRIQERSTFYRKQYGYPDLPKGYQITQGPVAIVEEGWIEIPGDPVVRGGEGPVRVRIERAHLEEDAGKSSHEASGETRVDLNRCGVPLLEIVGGPDLRSPQEAFDTLKALHRLVTFLGICDGNMEEGSLRCDANVSIRPAGTEAFGTRVEVKNLNSFRYVKQALEFEIARHIACAKAGEPLTPETRGWDAAAGETRPQRSKEAAMDYRYFPEPDLPVLVVTDKEVEAVRAALPELPEARAERFVREHGVSPYEASMLLQSREFADTFEALTRLGAPGKPAANWMLGEVSRVLNERGTSLEALGLDPADLAEMIRMVESGILSHHAAKERLFPALLAREGRPRELVERLGLAQVSDGEAIQRLVAEVLEAHPQQLAQFRAGKTALKGFFVGQVLKRGGGKVNPQIVNEKLEVALGG